MHFPAVTYKNQRISSWRDNQIYKLPSGLIVVIYKDLTKQKQTEEALKLSEAKF